MGISLHILKKQLIKNTNQWRYLVSVLRLSLLFGENKNKNKNEWMNENSNKFQLGNNGLKNNTIDHILSGKYPEGGGRSM